MTRRAASATVRRERSDAYVAARNPVEQTITGIWQEVFGLEQVGIHDNFFDLGGNSLVGLQLMSRVRKAFEIEMPMRALFDSPTVSGLAAFITDSQLKEQELEQIERLIKEIQELSPEDLQAGLI
jgi:acyl carrier protein